MFNTGSVGGKVSEAYHHVLCEAKHNIYIFHCYRQPTWLISLSSMVVYFSYDVIQ